MTDTDHGQLFSASALELDGDRAPARAVSVTLPATEGGGDARAAVAPDGSSDGSGATGLSAELAPRYLTRWTSWADPYGPWGPRVRYGRAYAQRPAAERHLRAERRPGETGAVVDSRTLAIVARLELDG